MKDIDKIKYLNAKDVLIGCNRFDLIFKYSYLENHELYKDHTSFYKDLYVEHIRSFNGFYEEAPKKESKEDFLEHFDKNKKSIIEKGFDSDVSFVTVDDRNQLTDGAHRLSICAHLNKMIGVKYDPINANFDYKFFQRSGIDAHMADFAALEYVKLSPNPYIVNIHSVVPSSLDNSIEVILEKFGLIFYKKNINLTFDGYVNFKKLTYGFDGDGASWLGDQANDFHGAKDHAQRSMGSNSLRVYVFICDSLEKVIQAKKEIRDLCRIGNYSVHINDFKAEALEIAQSFFNSNSLNVLNSRKYNQDTRSFDILMSKLKEWIKNNRINPDSICASGSTPMAVMGLRECRDLDFIHCQDFLPDTESDLFSSHESELSYYPHNKIELIQNPAYHFYYKGLKFITLDVLFSMKKKRGEVPKDLYDLRLIEIYKKYRLSIVETKLVFRLNIVRIKKLLRRVCIGLPKRVIRIIKNFF